MDCKHKSIELALINWFGRLRI